LSSKMRLLLWITAAAFLIGLMIITLSVRKLDCEDILLITPISSNTSAINAERLEEINGDHFLLTYEIISGENVQALNSRYDITLRKTNYTYRHIMGYRVVNGSFFTEEDQQKKQKTAVINEAAALVMFGNLDVCGRKIIIDQQEYTVMGVMADRDDLAGKDDDEEARYNVYIPASVSGENPGSFAVQLEDGLTAESAENECKDLTIPENGYAYIRLGALADLIYGMLFIALKSALIVISFAFFRNGLDRIRTGISQIKKLHKHLYFTEIFQRHPGLLLKTAATAAIMALTVMLILNTAFGFAGYFLLWNDFIPFLQYGDLSIFGEIASTLKSGIYLSVFFSAGFFLNIVLLLFSCRNNYFHRQITLER
jgi:hypothetical protein